jgi:DMSO/TMAO reductase YedYZ molybdopterin-dependent catalytic subunit
MFCIVSTDIFFEIYRVTATRNRVGVLLLATLLFAPAPCSAEDVVLAVGGEVKTGLKLTLTELKAMPVQTIEAKDHDGTVSTYQGVLLHDILHQAGVPEGEALRGPALTSCLLVKAADGYQVVFALPEIDPLFSDRKPLLAYRRNSVELGEKLGPLRLVVPDEKRQARWVKQVTAIEIIRVRSGSNP